MKASIYIYSAFLLSFCACAQSEAPESGFDHVSAKSAHHVPAAAVRDLLDRQHEDPFELAQRLLPTAVFEYSPEEADDISLAAALLMQECMADAGHEVELLGYASADEVRAEWSRTVHGIMFADMERIMSIGYAYWMPSDDELDSTNDRLTPAAYGVLNDRFGCRDKAYEALGVAEDGILSSGAPRSVVEYEFVSFKDMKTGAALEEERDAWSECMGERGFVDLRMDDPLPAHDPGNAQAIADAECRGPSGLRDTIIAVHLQATAEATLRFAEEAREAQAARAAELTAAHRVLEAHGIKPLRD